LSKYTKGDLIEVKIEKIVPRGLGLGFAEGLTVFVPLAAPQDVVKVRIRELKKRTAFADIVEIVEAGPNRIAASCPYYGKCGGCDFQHLDYQEQLAAKVGIISDCLTRLGKIDLDREIAVIPSPDQFGYRSRARWHVDAPMQKIGYYRRDSNEIVDIASCPILTPTVNEGLDALRRDEEWGTYWNDTAEIELAEGDGGETSVVCTERPDAPAEITSEIAGEKFTYTAETFFQANRPLAQKLVEIAIGDSKGGTALDLYCGVGLFALPLARRFETVVGVEENRLATDFAIKNAERAGLHNVEFVSRSVGAYLASLKASPDLILLDPPRSGTEKQTIEAIIKLRPKQISYVSCEPSILARDLRIMLDGGYQIESITAIDLFPQTHHVETVVRLKI
jgi:23S rRNA (uracil1939-C5)-methyltransferase